MVGHKVHMRQAGNSQTSDWLYPVSWVLAAKLLGLWAMMGCNSKAFKNILGSVAAQRNQDRWQVVQKCLKCLKAKDMTGLASLATYMLLCLRTIPVGDNPASTTLGPRLSPWRLSSVSFIKRGSLIYIYSICTHTSSHIHHRCGEPHWPLWSLSTSRKRCLWSIRTLG